MLGGRAVLETFLFLLQKGVPSERQVPVSRCQAFFHLLQTGLKHDIIKGTEASLESLGNMLGGRAVLETFLFLLQKGVPSERQVPVSRCQTVFHLLQMFCQKFFNRLFERTAGLALTFVSQE